MKILFVIALLIFPLSVYGNEDLFGDYQADINTDAKATTNKGMKAGSRNLKYRAKHNLAKNATYISLDKENLANGGLGLTLEQNSKVTGDIIMDINIGNNSTLVFDNDEKKY